MIRVAPQPQPAHFVADVETPGKRFLAKVSRPSAKEWRAHAYWTKVIPDMYAAYGGICHFSCHWIPRDTGSITIEHFKPKSKFPKLAYEWANFRLMCGTLNGRKKDFEDVLDPFAIDDDMFTIHFPSLLVKPTAGLTPAAAQKVRATIDRLRLNDDGTCLHGREHYVRAYCESDISFEFLKRKAPFVARELEKQDLVTRIKTVMPYAVPPKPQKPRGRR
ncbi:MAG: hypothetical protein C0501_18420 [Isosphaera sp.]|nr:hypothetical protein [Isosphaera sp.]